MTNAPTQRAFCVPLLIGVLCLIWGSTWWAIRICLRDQPPLCSAALRFLLAGALIAAITPRLRRLEAAPPPSTWLWLATGTLNFALAYGALYAAETIVPSGVAAVLWATFPLWMAASGVLVLGERILRAQWLGLLLAFGGLLVVFGGDLGGSGDHGVYAAMLVLLSTISAAAGTTLVKKFGSGTSSIVLNRNGMLFGAMLLAVAAVTWESPQQMAWSWPAVFATLYLAVFGTAAAFGIYFWLLRTAPASRLALISYVTPVLAMLLGAAVGDGEMDANAWLGTGLVVAGIALVMRKTTPHAAGPTPGAEPAQTRSKWRACAAVAAALLLAALWWLANRSNDRTCWPRAQILDAIRYVESGDRPAVPDGDDGRAIGPYQIHQVYWQDALDNAPELGGDYQDCRRRDYAERVVDAYMRKWIPVPWQRGEAEVIARVHNGGPKGAGKVSTLQYWRRVRQRLP